MMNGKSTAYPYVLVVFFMFLLFVACTDETEALEDIVNVDSKDKGADDGKNDKKSDELDDENAAELEKLKKKYSKEDIEKLKDKLRSHKDIENIKDTDERFTYVKTKIEEQKEFIKIGFEMPLDGIYQRQQAQKSKQPVFNLVYGYFLYGTARGDESKRNRGSQHIKRALELDPNFEYAHYVSGDTYINQYMMSKEEGYLKSAVEHYKKALKLRSSFYEVHRSLGVTYIETGKYDEAEIEIKKAIELNKDDAQNWIALISINLRRGEYKDAEKVIDEAQVSNKIKYQSYGSICLELAQRQLFTDAWEIGLKSFNMLKTLKDEDIPRDNWIQFYILMAKLAYKKSDSEIKLAIEFLDKVFEVEKTNLQASNTLMMIAAETKQIELLDSAIKKWLEYIESEPMNENEENRIFDWITSLAKILVDLEPNKIKGNKDLVLVLLKWALSVRGDEEDEALKKAGLYLEWMFPLNPDPENKNINYITDKDIKVIENPDDMKLIIKGLFRAVKSTQISVLRPTTEYLGAIVRAANIEEKDAEFRELVINIMNMPTLAKNNQIKAYLCDSIADYNDQSLLPYIIFAMKNILDDGSTSECHRMFPKAYRTFNKLLNDVWQSRNSDRKTSRRQLEISEYQQLFAGWLDELKKDHKDIVDQYEKLVEEAKENKESEPEKPEAE